VKKLTFVLTLALLVGCSTTSPPVQPGPPPEYAGANGSAWVAIGLLNVDPAVYGSSMPCPGADVDAAWFYARASSAGYTSWLLLDENATWSNVTNVVRQAAASVSEDGVLVVSMAGHGSQIRDNDGDEADGLDETVCLWDGQVRDDRVLALLHSLPPLRVLLINDQCHSEGNFRSIVRTAQQLVSLGYWGRVRPPDMVERRGNWNGQLIQLAACREADYATGTSEGGSWSLSLADSSATGKVLHQWYEDAAGQMPAYQPPVWVEYGEVEQAFRLFQVYK